MTDLAATVHRARERGTPGPLHRCGDTGYRHSGQCCTDESAKVTCNRYGCALAVADKAGPR